MRISNCFTLTGLIILFIACKKDVKGPVISSISPETGVMGETVIIQGSGFSSDPDDVAFEFNGKAATVLIATPEKLIVEVPRAAGTGPVTVTVNGKTTTGPVFNYIASTTVYTFAGGTYGDVDGTGEDASFSNPYAITGDEQGNLFIAEGNDKIKKISPGAVVTTMAGYIRGYRDGTGANAMFAAPQGLTTDALGNLYVADTYNHRIRKITPDAEVTTLAGSTEGFADGVGTNARFSYPHGICADLQGNLLVADRDNHRIRKITPQGAVTTLAGSTWGYVDAVGTGAKFYYPGGVAIDPQGNIYVADTYNHVIRKVTTAGEVSTLAGSTQGFADGTGTQAKFDSPFGITTDTQGNIYITELGNHKIRKITPSGVVTTIAGTTEGMQNGDVKVAQFNGPCGIVADRTNGNILYVADNYNYAIRKIVTE